MSSKAKQVKKRTTWTEIDELYLFEMWEDKLEMLRGSRKNGHVYKEMAYCFANRGRLFSSEEICVKIHNLTSKYRKEKQLVGPSGGSPSEWKYYHRVHAILGQLRIHNLELIVEESIPIETIFYEKPSPASLPSPCESPTGSDVIPETPKASSSNSTTKRKRKIDEVSASEKRIMKLLGEIKNTDEELINLEMERNSILDRFVCSSEQFHADLMAYLYSK